MRAINQHKQESVPGVGEGGEDSSHGRSPRAPQHGGQGWARLEAPDAVLGHSGEDTRSITSGDGQLAPEAGDK